MALPIVLWGVALWRLRRSFLFWAFVLVCSVVYFNTILFNPGEGLFACSIAAIAAAILLDTSHTHGWGDRLWLLTCAILLSHVYEAVMLIGPPLAMLSLKEGWRPAEKRYRPWWILIAVLFACDSIYAFTVYKNTASHLDSGLMYDRMFAHTQMICAGISATAVILSLYFKRASLVFVPIAYLALLPLARSENWPPQFIHNSVRLLACVIFTGCILALWASRYVLQRMTRSAKHLQQFHPFSRYVLPAFLLFVVLAAIDIITSFQYRTYTDSFRAMVDANNGYIDYRDSAMQLPNNLRFISGNEFPTLSLVMRTKPTGAIIINPAFGWTKPLGPFESVEKIPDLSRYYEGLVK
jgi:hypothetical protein